MVESSAQSVTKVTGSESNPVNPVAKFPQPHNMANTGNA